MVGAGRMVVLVTEGDVTRVATVADALERAVEAQSKVGDGAGLRQAIDAGPGGSGAPDDAEDLATAARSLCSAAHPGQVLLSEAARASVIASGEPVDLVDLGEHYITDASRPQRVFEVRHASLPAGFPPPLGLATRPTNLALESSTFVGRAGEIAAVAELVRDQRVVTLTGAGGSGKTRLAAHCAAVLLPEWEDGCWIVELAGVAESGDVEAAVAAVFARALHRPTATSAVDAIDDAAVLVVLDNCEHVITGATLVADVIATRCPRAHVLSTSRQPLGVRGEVVWAVPGLDPAEGVQLFEDRARQIVPGLDLSDAAAAVHQICERLDGLPLAIELAAVRLRSLGVAELAERLDARLALLTTGPESADPRQRTLRALIDWSYDLLDKPAQSALARLSVFRGTFGLDGAAEVLGRSAEDVGLLDTLDGLVQRSLLEARAQEDRVRYRLLETIREYAQERLDDAGATVETRDRHLRWAHALATELGDGLGDAASWRRLAADHDNFRAAIAWAMESGRPELAGEFAVALQVFWRGQGHLELATRWLAVALDTSAPDSTEWCEALLAIGDLEAGRGDIDHAVRCFEDALSRAKDHGWRALQGRALARLAGAASTRADRVTASRLYEEAAAASSDSAGDRARILVGLSNVSDDPAETRALLEEALDLWRSIGSAAGMATALANLGNCCRHLGDLDSAYRYLDEAVEIAEAAGLEGALALAHNNRGVLAWSVSEFDDARSAYTAALALQRRLGQRLAIARSLFNLGLLAHNAGDHVETRRLLREALGLWRRVGEPEGTAATLNLLGADHLVQDEHGPARRYLEEARAVADAAGKDGIAGYARNNLAQLEVTEGDLASAEDLFAEARHIGARRGDHVLEGDAIAGLAGLSVERGDGATARSHCLDALDLFVARGHRMGVPPTLETLAEAEWLRGQAGRAARLIGAAERMRVELGTARERRQVRVIDALLAKVDAAGTDATAERTAGAELTWSAALEFAAGDGAGTEPVAVDWSSAFRFCRDGETWDLAYESEAARFRHTKGFAYLALLVGAAGRELHVLDLVGAVDGGATVAGRSLPTLDPMAARAYRERLAVLEAEVDEALEFNDSERADRARLERDAVLAELTSAYGLGGRNRPIAADAERARKAVAQRVKEALARIERELPALGRHFEVSVRTGTYCSYRPDRDIAWELRPAP